MVAAGNDSDSEGSFHSFDDDENRVPVTKAAPANVIESKTKATVDPVEATAESDPTQIERFSPAEEATLLAESNALKASGNQLFGKGSFEIAVQQYDRALASCPNYLEYELAILRSNVAACHIKLEEWKEAIDSATKGIENLERLEPLPVPKKGSKTPDANAQQVEESVVAEIDEKEAERIEALQKSGHTLDEVRKLQIKLLMRRALARSRLGGWSVLQGADEDYQTLLQPVMLASISAGDKRSILQSAQALAPRLNAARDAEVAEMMDKLKGLGNSILKPFGLSTNNFQFVKDEKSGGYSMNFNQSAGR